MPLSISPVEEKTKQSPGAYVRSNSEIASCRVSVLDCQVNLEHAELVCERTEASQASCSAVLAYPCTAGTACATVTFVVWEQPESNKVKITRPIRIGPFTHCEFTEISTYPPVGLLIHPLSKRTKSFLGASPSGPRDLLTQFVIMFNRLEPTYQSVLSGHFFSLPCVTGKD